MSSQTEQLCPGIIKVTRDETEYLGFKISNNLRPDAQSYSSEKEDTAAYRIMDETVEPWKQEGSIVEDGKYIVGPFYSGTPLLSVYDREPGEAASLLQRYMNAAAVLERNNIEVPPVQMNAVLLCDDGSVLILSKDTVKRAQNSHTDRERMALHVPYNNPKRSGLENVRFAVAVMMYRILSGTFPYTHSTTGEMRYDISKARAVPLKNITPDISSKLSDDITNIITNKDVSQDPFNKDLDSVIRGDWKEPPGDPSLLLEEGEKLRNKYRKQKTIETFFRKNRNILLAAAAITIFVGAFFSSMITKALAPPITVGMSPVEVLELYFSSINNFDHMSLEDTVTKEAGGRIISEVTNLYVMARVRERYEGVNPFVNAQQWLDAGKPSLDSSKPVFGVANVDITAEGPAEFVVVYEKWGPVNMNDPDPSAPLEHEGIRYTRRFVLEEKRNAWIISEIETLKKETIRD